MSQFFIKQSYFDFEEYREAVKKWDLEFVQLGHGRFVAEILQFGDEELQVGKVQYNKLLLQNGSAPRNGYTFAIHHNDSAPFLWRYEDFGFNSIIVFPEDRELCGVSQPGHHPFIVTISEDRVVKTACALGLPEPNKFILKGSVSSCDPCYMKKVRFFLSSLSDEMTATQDQFSNIFIPDTVKRQLTSLLLSGLAKAKAVKPKKRNAVNRRKVIDRTLEHVDSNLSTPHSIQQLCNAANVDERTLRNIFYDHFFLSPHKFFKCYKLNAVRRSLLQSRQSRTKVKDVAFAFGFCHMGQFSADYFSQFGELPSATLSRI